MDTMIPDHEEAEFGDVIALLRRTYEVRAEDVGHLDERGSRELARPARRRANRRIGLSVAAAAMVVAGAAGVVVLRDRDETGPGGATTVPTPTTPVDTVVPTAPPEVAGGEDVTWFLPSPMPEGYELVDISAQVSEWSDWTGFENRQKWYRPAQAGAPGRYINTSWSDATVSADALGIDRVSVHGLDAYISPPIEDSTHSSISWVEEGSLLQITTDLEFDRDTIVQLAEASTVRPGRLLLDPALVPDGFELVDPIAGIVPADQQQAVRAVVAPTNADPAAFSYTVDTATISLNAMVGAEDERRTIDGVTYSISVGETGGDLVGIRWVADGWEFNVTTSAGVEPAMSVATSLRPVTIDQARAAVRESTDYVLSLPTVATGVFADGTRVSVHLEDWRLSEAAEVDAQTQAAGFPLNRSAICVEGAEPLCLRHEPERGEEDPGVYEVFDVGGQRRVIGWSDQPLDGADAEGLAIEMVPAESGSGNFLSVVVPPGEEIPLLAWIDGRGPSGAFPQEWIRP